MNPVRSIIYFSESNKCESDFKVINIILSLDWLYIKKTPSASNPLERQPLSVWVCARLTAEPAGAQRHDVNRRALVTGSCQSRNSAVSSGVEQKRTTQFCILGCFHTCSLVHLVRTKGKQIIHCCILVVVQFLFIRTISK